MDATSIEPVEDSRRWGLLQRRLQQIRTSNAVELLRSHGIEPIVIKGVAAARYYPEDKFRISMDVDLAVGCDDFALAHSVITGPAAHGMAIDLHRGLRHLDTAPWEDLKANSVELELPETTVRALRPEDDLRVLAVHWLTDGGAYKERLWDIFYLLAARDASFDWDRVVDHLQENRRRWLECALGAAKKYLDLDLDGTPFFSAEQRLPAWFVRTIEREWNAEIKPRPLEASLGDRRFLWAQVKRRMRPNPILATVDCEGSFDARTRIFYQIRNAIRRVRPSWRRVSSAVFYRPHSEEPT